MKLLSLFDGSGVFPLAASRYGITAAYASEVEPFPVAVTRARFPQMRHLGDITKIDGGKIEPCDLVTFGSPCTDISIAGKGEGLTAARSGLFFEAVRVIREMLETSGGNFPRYFLFENVPNLISIHKGEDWKIVMDEFSKLAESLCGGFICDPNILDSQEFGVAQRRKRIFIVGINRKFYNPADFANAPNARDKRMQKAVDAWGGETYHGITSRPHEVKRQKLSEILEHDVDRKYYLTQAACLGILRRVDAKGKEIPQLLRSALESQAGLFSCGENGEPMTFEPGATARLSTGKYWSGISPTLRADAGDNQAAVCIPLDTRNALRQGNDNCGVGIGTDGDAAYTVTAEYQGAVILDSHPNDSRIGIAKSDICQTLESRAGMGGGNVPLVAEPVVYGICSQSANSMNSKNPKSGVYECDTAKTLDTSAQTPSNQGGLVICVEGNGTRPSHRGKGITEDVSYTLNTVERNCVAYASTMGKFMNPTEEQTPTLMAGGNKDRQFVSYSMTTGSFAQVNEEQSPTLTARDFKDAPIVNEPAFGIDRAAYNQGQNALYKPQIDIESTHTLSAQGPGAVSAPPSYIVRRLTPTECLVLMNLSPDWCEDIAVAEPTEDDYDFWTDVFATLGKKKSRKQIAAFLKKPYSVGACYKMAGNGVVVAVVDWVIEGIADHAKALCTTDRPAGL
jgi:DNA (cytosine-5)-methyltransferase 1